jgi:hypothetical protein
MPDSLAVIEHSYLIGLSSPNLAERKYKQISTESAIEIAEERWSESYITVIRGEVLFG